jgi:regulator of protease activity HflC (stomatin/prohibitin superfamily)
MIQFLIPLLFIIFVLSQVIKILNEYERGVIFRLGRLISTKGPGIIFLIPFVDKLQRVSLRLETLDVPPQDVITRDNVSIQVNAVVYYRIIDPNNAIVEVEDYAYATSQLAQTTLRSVCGQVELDELLAAREKISIRLQEILDKDTDPWGIKVSKVEIKHIDLPLEMKRAMAKQAEAERLRRAKVIHAEGEYQAATRLSDAASIISKDSTAIHLRYLQTLSEVATEKNSVTLFPVPIDLLNLFSKVMDKE